MESLELRGDTWEITFKIVKDYLLNDKGLPLIILDPKIAWRFLVLYVFT